jgi:hypothetical protein
MSAAAIAAMPRDAAAAIIRPLIILTYIRSGSRLDRVKFTGGLLDEPKIIDGNYDSFVKREKLKENPQLRDALREAAAGSPAARPPRLKRDQKLKVALT